MIKTARQVLLDNDCIQEPNRIISTNEDRFITAMKEYANQFLDLASEEARFKELEGDYRDDVADTIENGYGDVYCIDKQSILKLKEQVK